MLDSFREVSLSLLYSILWSIVCTDLIPIRHVYLKMSPRGLKGLLDGLVPFMHGLYKTSSFPFEDGEFCRFKNGLGGGVNYVAIEPNFTLNHSQDYS